MLPAEFVHLGGELLDVAVWAHPCLAHAAMEGVHITTGQTHEALGSGSVNAFECLCFLPPTGENASKAWLQPL